MTTHVHPPITGRGPSALAGLAVLVVEDTLPIRRVLVTALERAGAEVTGAAEAETAVATCRARAAGGRPFDAVVLDHLMPRRDGAWAASTLRAEGFGGALIGFSAVAQGPETEAWRAAGCDAVLRKGGPLRELLTAVAETCRRPSAADSSESIAQASP